MPLPAGGGVGEAPEPPSGVAVPAAAPVLVPPVGPPRAPPEAGGVLGVQPVEPPPLAGIHAHSTWYALPGGRITESGAAAGSGRPVAGSPAVCGTTWILEASVAPCPATVICP